MKTKLLILAVLNIFVQTIDAQIFKVYKVDNSVVKYYVSEVDSIVFEPNDHEFVDLGLPSGTLWATCNVGANSPEENGDYFAWGETTTKNNYSWDTYKYCNGSETTMTKYCTQSEYGNNGFTDNMTELLPEDDAATTNWGESWQMPSRTQWEELINNSYTTTEWMTMNGKSGQKITSKCNDKSIFLPAAGSFGSTSLNNAGNNGSYWSRSLGTSISNIASRLHFESGTISVTDAKGRHSGRSVRPVRVQNTPPVHLVTAIVLSETSITLQLDEMKTLKATVQPTSATNKSVTWSSSNTSIATVDQAGQVIAIDTGTCTITCSAADGSGVKATCTVMVCDNNNNDEEEVTSQITAQFIGGYVQQVNDLIQYNSQLNFQFKNGSSKDVSLKGVRLINGTTGAEGNFMNIDKIVTAGTSVAYTITIGLAGIQQPICRFTYIYNNKEFTVDAPYKSFI